MKFQNCISINFERTHGRRDKPKAICPFNFSKVGGIMMCNNPNIDLVNMNVYMKFDEVLSICSKDIERKRNFGINQGP